MVFCCLYQEENEDRDQGKGFRKEEAKARGEGDYLGEGYEVKLAKEEDSDHLSYVHEWTE